MCWYLYKRFIYMNILNFFSTKNILVSGLFLICAVNMVVPMNQLDRNKKEVFVKTSNGVVVSIERWQISRMKTLLVLLEHQKGVHSYNNPLLAPMVDSGELRMLQFAFNTLAEQTFEHYFMDLAKSDGLLDDIKDKGPRIKYTLGEGALRRLVNAAEKMEAQEIVELCTSYLLPKDLHAKMLPHIIDSMSEFFKKEIVKSADKDIFSIESDTAQLKCCLFSPDGTKVYVGLLTGDVQVWDLSTRKLLTTFNNPDFKDLRAIALSADGQLCAAGGINSRLAETQVVVWNTVSGELVKEWRFNFAGVLVGSLAFNPVNNNQMVFSCYNIQGDTEPIVLDIEKDTVSHLTGYDHAMIKVSFSPDGGSILGMPKYQRHADVAVWDATTGNLITNIERLQHFDTTGAFFYGSQGETIISGIDFLSGNNKRAIRIGKIENNDYKVTGFFHVDTFFPHVDNQIYLREHDFFAQPNTAATKIALGSKHSLNDQPDDGFLLVICNKKFDTVLFDKYFTDTDIKNFQWSPDGRWIGFITEKGNTQKVECMLLLSEENEKIVNKLHHLSIPEIRFLYQLYCARLSGMTVGIKDAEKNKALFMHIPVEIQKLISKYLFNERQKCVGNECVIL